MAKRKTIDDASPETPVLTARCRTRSGTVTDLVVLDLTTAGCMIATAGLTLKLHQRVLIKLRPLEVMPGTVRWVEEQTAGIEFERPLYQPVLDDLRKRFAL